MNPRPISAVLVRTPGRRAEVGIQCQWLIKGELWGERGKGAESRGRVRRMRSQPATSRSLRRGWNVHCSPESIPDRSEEAGLLVPLGQSGHCASAARGKGVSSFRQRGFHSFIRGGLPEELAGATISDPSIHALSDWERGGRPEKGSLSAGSPPGHPEQDCPIAGGRGRADGHICGLAGPCFFARWSPHGTRQ